MRGIVFKPIPKLLGLNCFLLGLSFVLCAVVGKFCFFEPIDLWIHPVCLSVVLGIIGVAMGPRHHNAPLLKREILITVSLGWILSTLIGATPYLSVGNCDVCDALFESCSGLTSTGASALPDIEAMPHSLLLWRSLSQWLGGLGFVAFFVIFLGSYSGVDKFLYTHESTLTLTEDCAQVGLRRHILKMVSVYAVLTVTSGAALFWAGMDSFDATCHAMTGVGTGGFSTHNDGIASFHNVNIEWIVGLTMFLGGMNMLLLFRSLTTQPLALFKNTEFLVYVTIICVAGIFIGALLWDTFALPFGEAIRHGLFQAISILTTTGFQTSDINLWPDRMVPILLLLMFVGGCSGSTCGGLKIFRVVLLVKIAFLHVEKVFRRSIVRSLRLGDNFWSQQDQTNLLHYFLIFTLSFVAFVLVLGGMQPQLDFRSLCSLTTGCFCNVGVLLGSLGPTPGFSSLDPYTKVLVSGIMLAGRLELYALLVCLSPSFWKSFD
jgi:trk system potassium uptake protein TrkH